jgi:hypothetical protein
VRSEKNKSNTPETHGWTSPKTSFWANDKYRTRLFDCIDNELCIFQNGIDLPRLTSPSSARGKNK